MNNLSTINNTDITILESGEAFISQTKLATLCGISKQAIQKGVQNNTYGCQLNLNEINQLDAESAFSVVCYYANKNAVAVQSLIKIGAAGMKAYLYHEAGYTMEAKLQPKELTRLEILTMAIEAEKKVLLLESKIEEDKPKVELANDLLDSTGLTPIKLAAKELGIPPMTFFKMLRVDGIIDSHNIMYQRFINSGLGEIKVTTRNNKMFSSTLFTPKGLVSLHKKYKDYTNT